MTVERYWDRHEISTRTVAEGLQELTDACAAALGWLSDQSLADGAR